MPYWLTRNWYVLLTESGNLDSIRLFRILGLLGLFRIFRLFRPPKKLRAFKLAVFWGGILIVLLNVGFFQSDALLLVNHFQYEADNQGSYTQAGQHD